MVRLVDNDIIEVVLFEHVQIQSNTLNASTHDIFINLLDAVGEFSDTRPFPKGLKRLICLVDELHRMRNEEGSPAHALCVHYGGDRLSRSRRLI